MVTLNDQNQHPRATLFQQNDQASLHRSPSGDLMDRVVLGQDPARSGLFRTDVKHPRWLSLAAGGDAASLQINGRDGDVQVDARVTGTVPSLYIYGTDRSAASMSLQDGNASFVAYDPVGKASAYLDAGKDGGELVLYDNKGQRIVLQPSAAWDSKNTPHRSDARRKVARSKDASP